MSIQWKEDEEKERIITTEESPLVTSSSKIKEPILQKYNTCHVILSLFTCSLSCFFPFIGFLYLCICIGQLKSRTLKDLRKIILLTSIASTILYSLVLLILLLLYLFHL